VANWIGYSFVTSTLALNRNGAATFSVGEGPLCSLLSRDGPHSVLRDLVPHTPFNGMDEHSSLL
jgi:hypothetical protein